MAHRLASAFFPLPFLHFHNWTSASEQSMRHRIRAKDLILKVNLELLVFPSGARLTAAPCNSYFTDSERRRVTTLRWLIRSDETHRNWHLRRRRRKGTAHPASPSASSTLPPRRTGWKDFGGLDTLDNADSSARRRTGFSGEKLAKTLAFKSWGGDLWLFFPLSLNCSPSAGTWGFKSSFVGFCEVYRRLEAISPKESLVPSKLWRLIFSVKTGYCG